MKKAVLFGSFLMVLAFVSCGPAAEDREAMHFRAKSFQDSIARTIRAVLAEAEGPASTVAPAPVDTAAQRANTAQKR